MNIIDKLLKLYLMQDGFKFRRRRITDIGHKLDYDIYIVYILPHQTKGMNKMFLAVEYIITRA